MNRTKSLSVISNIISEDEESLEAREYFKDQYPGIKYIQETDSFLYRGVLFDYFKSGYKLFWKKGDEGFSGSYLLVDPRNYINHWLFCYGNSEERWSDYIRI